MGDFNRYLDHVIADDVLKEKTKQAVAQRLADIEAAKAMASYEDVRASTSVFIGRRKNRPVVMMRRILVTASAAAAAFAVLFAGYAFYRIPVSYVSMDINPGIELTLNAFGRVIGADAANEDGMEILAEVRINHLKADKAVVQLVQCAFDQGYIDIDGSTVISILAQSEDPSKALQMKEQISEGITEALEQNKAYAAIYADVAGLEFREAAALSGMSAGKYRLIGMLQAMDPAVTMDQYRNAKISGIIQKANDLAGEGNNLDSLDELTRAMVGRAQETADDVIANQIKAAQQKQEQNQNQNQSGGSQTSDGQGQPSSAGSQQGSDPNQGTSTGISHQSGSSGGGTGSSSGMSQTGGGSGQGGSGDEPYSATFQSGGGSGQGGSSGTSQTSGDTSLESSSGASQTGSGSGQGASSGTSQSNGNQSQGGSQKG